MSANNVYGKDERLYRKVWNLETRLQAASKRISKLRRALRPFVSFMEQIQSRKPGAQLLWRNLRNARAAIGDKP